MQRKFGMLLVLMLALSLVFCFGVIAWADEDPAEDTESTGQVEVEETEEVVEEEVVEEEVVEEEVVEEEVVEEEVVEEEVAGSSFEIPVPTKVVVSNQALMIDGELVEAEAYNIDGSNYFKLRDLAALMAATGSQFNVSYEEPNMIVTTGEAYTALDSDLTKGEDKSASCQPSKQVLLVNGEQVDVLVYNIGGNNFFQLRGLDALLGFTVSYDEATRTMVVETADADADADVDEETGEEIDEEGDEEGDEEVNEEVEEEVEEDAGADGENDEE